MKKILIVGSAADRNLIRFLNNLTENIDKSKLTIDLLDTNPPLHSKLRNRISELNKGIRNHYTAKDVNSKNAVIRRIKRINAIREILKEIPRNEYDLINIHYMSGNYYPLMKLLKRKTAKIMISPWGSDVYRVNGLNKALIRLAYKYSDYISFGSLGFKDDINKAYSVPESKFIKLSFGSEMIDIISENPQLTNIEAKSQLNYENKFIITCGYNASEAHNHIGIIENIKKVREQLPKETLLIFPMNYARNINYINEVKLKLRDIDFNYVIIEKYLSNKDLLLLRKATDLFIHVQNSDAFAATIQEFLLCNTKIINGNWLSYPDLEKWGKPYKSIKSIDYLANAIIDLSSNSYNYSIPDELKKDITLRGYKTQITKWIDFYSSI